MTDEKPIENNIIKIITLGQFDILKGNNSLVSEHASAFKIWELFKYVLTNKDKPLTPETIVDQLWISQSYNDPKTTLRKQMQRLREILPIGNLPEDHLIDYSNGYYRWNTLRAIQLDSKDFENEVQLAELVKGSAPTVALNHLLKALDLYGGDYLPECTSQHWVFSARNFYKRLYYNAVMAAAELLYSQNDLDHIIRIFEKAISLDLYEEGFHIQYMDALARKGYHKQALSHYEYITSFYHHEMGINPTSSMKQLYKRILKSDVNLTLDSNIFEPLDTNQNYTEAFYCDPDVFKSIFELETRRSQRSNQAFTICLISVEPLKNHTFSQMSLRMKHLLDHLLLHLRKGDTLTQWSDQQLIVLMNNVSSEQMEGIMARVLADYPQRETLHIKPITHLNQKLP